MQAAKGEPGSWVSEAAREKFMVAYERAFALWPQPAEELDVETRTPPPACTPTGPIPTGRRWCCGCGRLQRLDAVPTSGPAKSHPVYGVELPGDRTPASPAR